MALCETVAVIADLMIEGPSALTLNERCLLHVIRNIPFYRDIGRLDLWESACGDVTPDNLTDTETGLLLDELIMLGRCNLYQAFQPQRTREYYDQLIPYFAERGVNIPADADLSCW